MNKIKEYGIAQEDKMYCQKCGKENPEDERFCMHCGADLSGYKVEISPKIDVSPKISISTMDKEQISLLVDDKLSTTMDKEQISLLVDNKLSKALEKAHTFKDTQAKEVTPEEEQAFDTLQKIAEDVGRRKGEVSFSKYDPHDLESCVKFLDTNEEIFLENLDKEGKEAFWFVKGSIFFTLGRHSEALVCWDKVLEINPQEEAWWSNRGRTLKELKRYDEAVHCFNKVLDMNPEYDLAWAEKGYDILRQAHEFIRKLLEGKISKEEFKLLRELEEEARRYINKALEINPQLEWAWLLKSNIGKDINERMRCIDEALKINPRSAVALYCMGLGKYHSAEIDLIDFNDWTIKNETEYKSRLWEAIEFFDKALEIEPDDAKTLKERKKLLKELRELS